MITWLSTLLGVPLIPVVARTGFGCEKISAKLAEGKSLTAVHFTLDYGQILEQSISRLTERLPDQGLPPKRWLALQFFEGNPLVTELLQSLVDREWLQNLFSETE